MSLQVCRAFQSREPGDDGRSKELGRSVSYNILVTDGSSAAPRSSLDGLNGVVEFEDVAGSTTGGDAPLVMVKVTDKEANGEQTLFVPTVQCVG